MLAGSWLQDVAFLTLLPTLTLGALAVPQLRSATGRAAGAAAVLVALTTLRLDGGLALLLCAAAGVTAASIVDRRTS